MNTGNNKKNRYLILGKTFQGVAKTYETTYCNHCETNIISCSACQNSSCNGGGCQKFYEDFSLYLKSKQRN